MVILSGKLSSWWHYFLPTASIYYKFAQSSNGTHFYPGLFFAKVALHHLFPWHKCLKISPTEEFHLIETTWFHLFFMCWKDLLKIGANKGFWEDWTVKPWVGEWVFELWNSWTDWWMNDEEALNMTHSQMLGKVEYGLPAKIWRLVGCTEMLSW